MIILIDIRSMCMEGIFVIYKVYQGYHANFPKLSIHVLNVYVENYLH